MEYYIRNHGGHVEVTDSYGHFVFSADTVAEANQELADMECEENPK